MYTFCTPFHLLCLICTLSVHSQHHMAKMEVKLNQETFYDYLAINISANDYCGFLQVIRKNC